MHTVVRHLVSLRVFNLFFSKGLLDEIKIVLVHIKSLLSLGFLTGHGSLIFLGLIFIVGSYKYLVVFSFTTRSCCLVFFTLLTRS